MFLILCGTKVIVFGMFFLASSFRRSRIGQGASSSGSGLWIGVLSWSGISV